MVNRAGHSQSGAPLPSATSGGPPLCRRWARWGVSLAASFLLALGAAGVGQKAWAALTPALATSRPSGGAERESGSPDLQTILRQLQRQADALPAVMGFRQEITLRAFFQTWRFSSFVTRRGGEAEVRLDGAPPFLPREMTGILADVTAVLSHFELALVGEERDGATRYYVVEGRNKLPGATGAQAGRLWVEAGTWLVTKAEARYLWGTLRVEQTFRREGGYTVLDRQQAVVSPLAVRLEVAYRDYWFKVPPAR